jgi:hypothetical protein
MGVSEYRAKNLPAWVRLRAKAVVKPVYTVPTVSEHQIAQIAAATDALLRRQAQEWYNQTQSVRVFMSGGTWGAPLRIRLPEGY